MNISRSLAIAALAGGVQAALAQAVPGTVDPGQLGREIRPPPAPRVQPEVPRAQPPVLRETAPTGPEFRVDAVRLEGNTVLSAEALRPAYAELVGKTVHLGDLEQAADRMTAQYRNAGYLLAQVVVPAQSLGDGGVRFQVFEGHVDSAVYQGEQVPAAVRDYVQKIIDARPLTAAVLERYLLLINDIPGVTARAALGPSPSTPGAAELTLVVGTQRWSGDVGVDNRLTRSLGHARVLAGVQLANAWLSQERFSARLIESDDDRLTIGSLGWEQAWGAEGFKTNLTLGAVRTRPDLALAQTSSSRSLDAGAAYPLLRSRERNVYLRATLSVLNSRAALEEGGGVLFDDHVRALRLGLNADAADAFGGVNLVDVEASQGLGGRGGAPASRANADTRFTKLTLFASRLQALAPRVSVLLAFNGQATGDTLFSSEQFGAGGDAFLRAFDPSELIGDRGWAAKLELRFVPRDDAMAYAFYDHARVSNAAPEQAILNGASAATAGLGARYAAGALNAFIEAAKPLRRDVAAEGDRKARLFAGIRYSF